jgi:hypothetical protein
MNAYNNDDGITPANLDYMKRKKEKTVDLFSREREEEKKCIATLLLLG